MRLLEFSLTFFLLKNVIQSRFHICRSSFTLKTFIYVRNCHIVHCKISDELIDDMKMLFTICVYSLVLTYSYIFVHIRDVLFLGNIRLKISLQSSKFSSIFELFKKKSNNSMLLNYIAAKIVRFIASMTQTSYITPLSYVSYRLLL